MLLGPLKASACLSETITYKRLMSNASTARRYSRSKPLSLLRLPVPRLRDTLDRYLESLEPFLLEREANGGQSFDDSMRVRVNMADEFERGIGGSLQERLLELDKRSPYNWLDDNFWLRKAYLEVRSPLLINSNWWLAYKDDSSVPEAVRNKVQDLSIKRAGISGWQVRRSAWLLSRTLQFKERIESQDLYPETTYTGLWMRDTVPRMFNVCRIPQAGCDRLSTVQASSTSRKKVLVMLHDWIYTMDVYDSGDTNVGHVKLEKRIRDIVLDVERRLESGEKAIPVGIMTSDDRDTWTNNYTYLSQISPLNSQSLQTIQDSLMVLSLDHYTYETSDPYPSEFKSHLQNIRSGLNARNRWFDKGITLIVENNSRAGMMGEHSPVDALVPSIVADYSLAADMESDTEWKMLEPFENTNHSMQHRSWERLEWDVDEYLVRQCGEAEERAKAVIADSDDDVVWFTEYGTDWLKNIAVLPPDAYIQMAMQLAWYRMRGTFTATYETALTRLFVHGRTETIRTLTKQSREFVLAMCDSNTSNEIRLPLLRSAIATHAKLTKSAATGKGIDRHLLALRLLMKQNERSPLFEDELFAKSQEWKLSTSGLSAGTYFRGTGFGSPYHDGYGINYLAAPDMIKFGIESKFSCPSTSTEKFKSAISSSLLELQSLILSSIDTKPIDVDAQTFTNDTPRPRL